MRARVVIVLVAVGLVGLFASPAHARTKDSVVVRDTLIRDIWALDGDVVYQRYEDAKPPPKRGWMVRYKGRVHQAHGIPSVAAAGGLGLDAKSRKVFTFGTAGKWFAYDLATDRARPLGDLGTSCPVGWLSIWRNSTAYETSCPDPYKDEMFIRRGNQTRRIVVGAGPLNLTFRDGTLAGHYEDGNDNEGIMQYAAGGKACLKIIPGSVGDGTAGDTFWIPRGRPQIVNGYVAWLMGDPLVNPDFRVLAAKVRPGCAAPEPVGVFPFKPKVARVQALTVDDRRIFYADGKTLRRQVVPARPSTARPANDDFKHARKLSGNLPLSAQGTTAFATVERGEPLEDAKHTVWYAFRAKATRRTYVTVDRACGAETEDACSGVLRYGVYKGSSVDKLTVIPRTHPPSAPHLSYTRIDAVAGRTYWIAVGSSYAPNQQPFTVHVAKKPVF